MNASTGKPGLLCLSKTGSGYKIIFDEQNQPLSVTSLEGAYSRLVGEAEGALCAVTLVVQKSQAGLALRLSAMFPRINVALDPEMIGTLEWKLIALTPAMFGWCLHSTGCG
jgi:hypothetical protein